MKVDSSGVFVIKKVREKDSASYSVIFAIVLVTSLKVLIIQAPHARMHACMH